MIKKEKLNLPGERHKILSLFVFEVNGEILLSLLFPKHAVNDLVFQYFNSSVSVNDVF